jgi:hypothetical protein
MRRSASEPLKSWLALDGESPFQPTFREAEPSAGMESV